MRRTSWIVSGGVALVVVAATWVWRADAGRRDWERTRPALPPLAGSRAPGLDARLERCAARFAQYPPDRDALVEFARVCHANGFLEPALEGYAVLARLQPEDGQWPYLQAVIHAGFGRLDTAEPLLRRATELAPGHVPAWLRLGAARLKADDPAGAAAAYDEALRRAPEDPHALLGLARCALRDERWTAARGLLQRAIAADARLAPAFHLLATVHERLGNAAAAATVLARAEAGAMEVEPPDPWIDTLYRWGHDTYRLRVAAASALAGGDLDRALAACERARELAPDDGRVHWQFGRIFLRIGRPEEARVHFEEAVRLDPADEKAHLDLIGVLNQLGETGAASDQRAVFARRFGAPPSS